MHKNQSGIFTNSLSSHSSLLLSTATPTIITSPLHNNTNSPQNTSLPTSVGLARRQPSTPLLVASNLDNETHIEPESPPDSGLTEGFINFKKPQNEMFKKLDGKIQKIVAAHSNLNKLYALNDFSGLGAGPKRPFELPPQLPPPPPWVPKVNNDFGSSWSGEHLTSYDSLCETKLELPEFRPSASPYSPNNTLKLRTGRSTPGGMSPSKPCSPSIDSAISKLHQRRQQQQVIQRPGPNQRTIMRSPTAGTSTTVPMRKTATMTPAQFSQIAQKIKEILESDGVARGSGGNLSDEHKKKFQEDLVALLKREISAVSKSAKLRFSTPPPQLTRPQVAAQKAILMKSSPQTLFNTIRRETKLLLTKLDGTNRPGLNFSPENQSLLRQNDHENLNIPVRLPINRLHSTIKVVVPPTEYQTIPKSNSSESILFKNSSTTHVVPKEPSLVKPRLSYQVIRSKMKLFQQAHQISLGRASKFAQGIEKRRSSLKSLDKIVDRLQARGSPTSNSPTGSYSPGPKSVSLHQQIINSSASLLQTSRNLPSMTAPTPIPVFRFPLAATSKGGYFCSGATGSSKIVNVKSKKSKKFHHFGIKIANYLERECPQPATEKISVEQFAKCLNLVRSNDASLQTHQQKLLHSESRWRMPVGNRPLRLRRIRGERVHMPASASYRATRKVGLQ